ncbi:endonuclease/exonuclease/phosphatase family protein [Sphingomonas prati]|uniref:Endonuclease/exonuclease/phosphatase family metal-dependent hydrolase n=1 Tax=Sphingomonas prati TaxID=1843237 RepID=A0A7W9BRX5_9SPHN|nr:endonuclease/exonuclease/phosphatase family protein [Sphingomonas prati]MBB5728920.1 endonuclease/exonuclease/phosphatase family metal-dependent hydrolase [Sphingomonas prati]GGE86530.1 endonuclease [Sphingomonas prati]
MTRTITVASYNIHKAVGTDRKRRPDRILEVLHEIDADIVALQEADQRFGAKLTAIPIDLIAERSDYRPVGFGVRPGGIGWHGNAIFVRKSATITDCRPLDLPVLEPRGAVLADVRVDGADVRIVGMHLDLSGLWRRRQAKAVIAHVAACERAMPTVLMGDLNEWSLHGGCLRDFGGTYRFAATGRSFHARRPMAALDRILVGPGVEVIDSGVHHSHKASLASDHLPIWAKLRVPAPSG